MKYLMLSFILLFFSNTSISKGLDKVIKGGKEKTVRFALWGGNEKINHWIDHFVSSRLKERFNIKLIRTPLSDTELAVKKLMIDKKFNREAGSIDILWVNGENFKNLKERNLTWKSFLKELSNSQYLDLKDESLTKDFGIEHLGHEAPWGKAQFVYIFNQQKMNTPLQNPESLYQWVKMNPGKFTYPAPPDFTATAFLRDLLLQIIPSNDYNKMINNIDHQLYKKYSQVLWAFLNKIKPFLYRKGQYYPESLSKVHQLYADEVIYLTFDYYPLSAQRNIEKKFFPEQSHTFVMSKGSLSNTHFLSIPFNSPSKEAAMTSINFLLSFEAQVSKFQPKNWGDFPVLNLEALTKKQRKKLQSVDLGEATLPLKKLINAQRTELPASYIGLLEKDWKKYVAK
jgi:putative spermidine/putrescine transport system substrate-binding protein